MDYTKAMFGCHAMHMPMQMVIQDHGKTPCGKFLAAAVVILSSATPILSEVAIAGNCPHELLVGDMIIRPHGKWTSRQYIGTGLGGLITSSAMFPEGWDTQSLANGYPLKARSAR